MSINVEPSILVWARETAGLDVSEAANKLGLSNSVKSNAIEKLLSLETGEKTPSKRQLDEFARVYKRPLLTFYLDKPPKPGKRGHDFRQTHEIRGKRESALLNTLLRDIHTRQKMVQDILLDDNTFEDLDFTGSMKVTDGVNAVVESISAKLGFNFTDPEERKGDADQLFKRLRNAAEHAGIFVLVLSDLGSWHSALQADVFRGFTIADKIAPFIVINPKDAKPARSFTLIHELAHIWLGQSGISSDPSTSQPKNDNARIEQFCNDVAAEFLLPEQFFQQDKPTFEKEDMNSVCNAIDMIARRWSVSQPMVAYRLQRNGDLSTTMYKSLYIEYRNRWLAKVKKDKEQKNGAPHPLVVKQFSLGNAFVGIVCRALRENNLTHTKAATLLGSNPSSVEPLLRNFESKREYYVSSHARLN